MTRNKLITLTPQEAKEYRAILAARHGLSDPDKIQYSDIVIEKMNREAIDYLGKREWSNYRNNRELCIHYLIKDQRYITALPFLFEFFCIFHYCNQTSITSDATFNSAQTFMIKTILEKVKSDFKSDFREQMNYSPLRQKLNINIEEVYEKYMKKESIEEESNKTAQDQSAEEKNLNNQFKKEYSAMQAVSFLAGIVIAYLLGGLFLFIIVLAIGLISLLMHSSSLPTKEITCIQCNGKMNKEIQSSGNILGILIAILVFFTGLFIIIFTFFTIIGPIIGLILMLISLGMGGKRTRIWKCNNCGYYFSRF